MSVCFHDTSPTEIYTLSLHDALPISRRSETTARPGDPHPTIHSPPTTPPSIAPEDGRTADAASYRDRKSTRLNSSHRCISYAVFCLKKKNKHHCRTHRSSQDETRYIS